MCYVVSVICIAVIYHISTERAGRTIGIPSHVYTVGSEIREAEVKEYLIKNVATPVWRKDNGLSEGCHAAKIVV